MLVLIKMESVFEFIGGMCFIFYSNKKICNKMIGRKSINKTNVKSNKVIQFFIIIVIYLLSVAFEMSFLTTIKFGEVEQSRVIIIF